MSLYVKSLIALLLVFQTLDMSKRELGTLHLRCLSS